MLLLLTVLQMHKHLALKSLVPTRFPPATGPLHMLALPQGMMVVLLFFLPTHLPVLISHIMSSGMPPLTFVSSQVPMVCSYEHFVLDSLALSTD